MSNNLSASDKEIIQPISIHIHSFSLRFQFKYRNDFNVFNFIELADHQGFSGINVSANGPGYRDLGGITSEHFAAVKRKLADHDLRCELDTSDTRPKNLETMLGVASAIGAEQLRVYTRYSGTLAELIQWTIADLKAVAPKAEEYGINILLENHEDFQGAAIAEILTEVNHPNIRALYDYGNSQMVAEDPFEALEAMLPFTTAVHMKDHLVIQSDDQTIIQGVPFGDGLLPIMEQTERLYSSGLRRFCFENVWGYNAQVESNKPLPNTPPFKLSPANKLLDANNLNHTEAIELEMMAFHQAWKWFRDQLKSHNYRITRHVR
jgi:sugar phosphate isomerase/epimerase